jgi:hypothetical protein
VFKGQGLIVIVGMLCQFASGRAPPPVSPESREVVALMHWFNLEAPLPVPPPPFAPPTAPPPPVANPVCPPGNLNCGTPAPPPTIDENYRSGYVPADVAALLGSELPRLIKLLPPGSEAKLKGWSVSITNCSASAPFIVVCKDLNARVIRIAPILVRAIFGRDPRSLVEVQLKLQSFGADPGSFDGTYQPIYATHGLAPGDWNAVLSSYANILWTPFVSSVDFVIAQQMASVYLSSGSKLPASDVQVNQEAKALSTTANGVYDASGLIQALAAASGKYDKNTWGYQSAGDVDTVLGAIPASTP